MGYRANALGKSWREMGNEFLLSNVTFDERNHRLISREIIIQKRGGIPQEYMYNMLHYELSEIKLLLESLGVIDITFYGDAYASKRGPLFSREGFNKNSHVMIVKGRKRMIKHVAGKLTAENFI